LSYPALDATAQPLAASPYLEEVERACGPGRLKKNAQPQLTYVPEDDAVCSPRDFRVRAVAQALTGAPALLAELAAHPSMRETAAGVLAALETYSERSRGESFGPFEGMLASAAARKLEERFGPARCWSPSQLEQYAYCPFQFFMQGVLHAEPVAEPRLAVDYMERGRLLHWVLSMAHRQLNELAGGPSSPARDPELFSRIVQSLVAELREGSSEWSLSGGMAEIDLRKVLAWIDAYRRQHAQYEAQWTGWRAPLVPAHFEVSFGPRRDAEADEAESLPDDHDPLSTLEPFELDCGVETIRFAGRIDRIDVGQLGDRVVFSVLDYKSGRGSKRTSLDWVEAGNALQLPLYALAARWLLAARQAEPVRAAYWHVGGAGYTEKEAVKLHVIAEGALQVSPEWQALEARLPPRVRSLVAGIRTGQFPMHSADDTCTGNCPYRTVCRVNHARALVKGWRAPGEETP
jgi:hypothetical protein